MCWGEYASPAKNRRLVISGDCVYDGRNINGHSHDGAYVSLASGMGSIWEHSKTMNRINTEIGGDLDRLIILHDSKRWSKLFMIKEIEGFRILEMA